MAKINALKTLVSGFFSTTSLNDNFNEVESAFDNTLSRDGSTPNQMLADFDLNSNDILNGDTINTRRILLNGVNVETTVSDANTSIRGYESRASVVASNVPASTDIIQTGGYATIGDGGAAIYIRVGAEPAHEGKIQSNDGAWWELAERVVRPEMFGALGDGTDDQEAFDDFLAFLGDGVHGIVDRTHTLLTRVTITSKDDFIITGRGGLVMDDAAPNTTGNGALFVDQCSMFEISGLTFDGNLANRGGNEVSSHLLHLRECSFFVIRDVTSKDSTVDGIYFNSSNAADVNTHNQYFLVDNCLCEGNYRNGLSIIQGRYFVIRGGTYRTSSGTAPQAGIDLESNPGDPSNSIRDGLITGVHFGNNVGYGLQVSIQSDPIRINVVDCRYRNNTRGDISAGWVAGRIANCFFTEHTQDPDFAIVYFPAGAGNIHLVAPFFRAITFTDTTKHIIRVRSGADDIIIEDLDIEDSEVRVLHSAGKNTQFRGARVNECAFNPCIEGEGVRFLMENCLVEQFNNRGVLIAATATDSIVRNNRFRAPTSNSTAGVIALNGAGWRCDGNILQRTSAAGYGIVSAVSYKSLTGNEVDGFTGNGFALTGDASTESVGYNRRNIDNGSRLAETAIAT